MNLPLAGVNGEDLVKRFGTRLRIRLPELLLLSTALVLRLPRMAGPFEYDEIWSLEHFAKAPLLKTFTDFNHLLNSLWMRLMYLADGPMWSYRIASLVSGIGIVWLFYLLGRRFHGRCGGLLMMVYSTFSLPLITYAQTARGYSLQLFFLLAFALLLSRMETGKPYVVWGMVLTGILAELAVITSVVPLFLLSCFALWYLYRKRALGFRNLSGFALLAGFTLCWYLGHFTEFKNAQSWGVPLTADQTFAVWFWNLFQALGISLVLVGPAVACLHSRRALLLAMFLLMVPCSELLTQGGPPRAHLFLIPAAALILTEAGIRFCGRLKLRFGICAAILLLSQFSSWGQREWARPDFFAIAHELGELPEEVLWVVPANDTYPLSWNNRPHVMQDFLARLVVTPYSERSLLLVDGMLQGVDSKNMTVSLPLPTEGFPVSGEHFEGRLHRLSLLKRLPVEGEVLLFLLRPSPPATGEKLLELLRPCDPVTLNVWLMFDVFGRDRRPLRYRMLAVRMPGDRQPDWLAMCRACGGALSIYRLD